ncbi:DUF5707 domain-containing protein [Streptomyces stelliscabiei]|uniref:Uncharacterized protein n=1 Tax=Streptomyces stelliscabiei TaxID=146820 RepID=A0A8I0TX31_9ACTN|nr:DUF5707 domain-containing protein [Streptomyces stelliscabiei]KND43084.1 hypothetical protein IQ64_20075 [Streptomyces stelliscabiei]MBE1602661.1 hypothetical protein [Streptomyces stelliscabiei]MDX2516871.1 DUF5707 domain-containing protein [Streptomyces stelliscabiei]MDX2550614.1 DUF5707 domain-containing protein [Streptomyces stelliscabiei]MDX2610312.1 DUF5707 domain-containing protein [Streptomyces stelliscabiei]
MSRRIALSVTAGVVVLAGAGAFSLAYAGGQPPALEHSKARYTAPDGDRVGSLTFTTVVTASSDVKSVKVLAWPANSSFAKKGLTAKDMAAAERAVCEPSGGDTERCTYKLTVTRADAEGSPQGRWHVAVLATAENGDTTLDTKAADFTVG